jgi:hypothetical protein
MILANLGVTNLANQMEPILKFSLKMTSGFAQRKRWDRSIQNIFSEKGKSSEV